MNRRVSLYLDAARFAAAMMVFLSHLSKPRITHGFLGFVPDFSSEAVDAFFVISGFVIAYVTFQSENDALSYTIRRAARIYSVALPAIALTLVLDAIGMTFGNPAPYLAGGDFDAHNRLAQILTSLSFTGSFWGNNIVVGTNSPYWSLSFEVTYYVAFGLFMFLRGWARFVTPALLLICAGPQIAIMLPVWLMGVAVFWICRTVGFSSAKGAVILLLSGLCFVAFKYLSWRTGRPLHNPLGLSTYSNTFEGYVYGAIFSASIIGIQMIAPIISLPIKLEASIRWIADRTFAIYLFHLPLMHIVVATCRWPNTSWAARLLILVIPLISCFGLAELTERQKFKLRYAIEKIVAQLGRRPSDTHGGDRSP